jgi:hypothetical protein
MSYDKTTIHEILIAFLLGVGAICGGWAGYQSSQWGGTATEDYGKAATTATRASTQYNEAITIANRDSALDIQAKQLVLSALTTQDALVKERDLSVAKYLYTQQMTKAGYLALGFPAAYHTKDRETYLKFSDEEVTKGLEAELGAKYTAGALAPANATFAEADKTFAEGQKVSGYSTQFGLTGMFFTVALFLAGLGLVIKSGMRWGFIVASFAILGYGVVKLLSIPWYHA